MERAFRGVWIPASIYLNGEITPTEKFLLAEIESLDVGEGTSEDNGYFATFCDCDERSIRRFLVHLRLLEMIEIEYKNGKRIIRRLYKDTVPTTIKDRFVPPTLEEVKAYCKERGNSIEAERFCDYYAARGWMVSKDMKMLDWRAMLRAWESLKKEQERSSQAHENMEHHYSEEKLKSALVNFDEWEDDIKTEV